MQRYACSRVIAPLLNDELVVASLGNTSTEWRPYALMNAISTSAAWEHYHLLPGYYTFGNPRLVTVEYRAMPAKRSSSAKWAI